MKISLKILESSSQIAKSIANALKPEIDKTLLSASQKATKKLQPIIAEALRSEPEYQSLTSGSLRLEFGIPDPSVVESIVEKLASTVKVENTPCKIVSNILKGGFKITALKTDDMDGLVGDQDAIVVDSTRGYSLPWLSWLLYEGNKAIVKNYEVKLGNNSNSRTGMAIMITSDQSWRVPPEFAGKSNSNWTTRAIDRISNQIEDILRISVEESL